LYNGLCLIIFPGFPTTTEPSGISFNTTLPAPITHHFPTFTPGKIITPAPTCVPSPTVTFPNNVALGDMWTKSSITQSCSIIVAVLMITCFPIYVFVFTTAFNITTVPLSILEVGEIDAFLWIQEKKILFINLLLVFFLVKLSPIAIII